MTSANFPLGLWRLADPRLTLASLSSITLGTAAAAREGPIHVGWLVVTVAGIVALEVAKNASGEVSDFASGADQAVRPEERSPFSGGRRVLVDGLLSCRQAKAISAITYTIGALCGLAIVLGDEPKVLVVGVAGVVLAWTYGSRPLQLAYHGWGETAVAISYGPLICCGAFLAQRHTFSLDAFWLSIPLGLAIGGFLWINEFPDARADALAGKRNCVVRLGRVRAAYVFAGILAVAYGLQACLPALGVPLWGALAGLLGLPLAAAAAVRAIRFPEKMPAIIVAQGCTLISFVVLAAAGAAALVFSHP